MKIWIYILISATSLWAGIAYAQTQTEIEAQIGTTSSKIKALEAEIAQYEKELVLTERQKNNLAKALKTLDLSRKKLETETKLTANKIDSTSSSIKTLEGDILVHDGNIENRLEGLGESMRSLSRLLDNSAVEIFLSDDTLANSVDRAYNLERLQISVRDDLEALQDARRKLVENKTSLESEQIKLTNLKGKLNDQERIVVQSQKEKSSLLAETKNKETQYRSILEEKIKQKEEFERELRSFEARLKAANLGNIPAAGSGVLAWPLDNVFITQYFGNTEFAKNNAQVYNGRGHNAIDFRASLGTPVKSAASGRVVGTGNTDLGCPGGSYGKWVLVEHNNGLSTLYAHLSLIKVVAGEEVSRGGLLGYSGSTGYSTGPHLHFAVYASEGVKISKLTRVDGTTSKCDEMPVSPLNGYLNPLLYL